MKKLSQEPDENGWQKAMIAVSYRVTVSFVCIV